MPQDIRHVLFNEREVCEMVFDLLASRGDKRTISGARIEVGEEHGGVCIRMHYSAAPSSERQQLLLAGREALAAAILFCRSHHVPLPMKADKTLQMIKGHLALVLGSTAASRA